MHVLILGGTAFLGRHLSEAALAAGHRLTLFHRGVTGRGLFDGRAEVLLGDRAGDLAALEGRRFDAVIDTIREAPPLVDAATRRLADGARLYVFVSTVSVYRDFGATRHVETDPVVDLPTAPAEETYATRKVRSERLVVERFAGRALVVRPGLIVGPWDPTDRFTYWVRRLGLGGTVLAPGSPERPVQLLDARDLAEWIVRAAAAGLTGTFNATGPEARLTLGALLERCRSLAGSQADPCWVGEAFPREQGLTPYLELPLWLPEATHPHANEIPSAAARDAGLRFRDVDRTIRDVAAWDRARGAPPLAAGIDAAREGALLQAFRRR